MTRDQFTAASVFESLCEFDRVAGLLDMPLPERLGIMNVSEATYVSLRSGKLLDVHGTHSELTRRLSYALPLMRRLAAA